MARPIWSGTLSFGLVNPYGERGAELVEAKRPGSEVVAESAPPADTKVVELMSALRASVERSGGERRSGRGRGGTGGDRRANGRNRSSERGDGDRSGRRETTKGGSRCRSGRSGGRRSAPRGGAGGGRDELSALKTDEPRKLARELDVPGRSTMRHDELVSAVGRRSGGRHDGARLPGLRTRAPKTRTATTRRSRGAAPGTTSTTRTRSTTTNGDRRREAALSGSPGHGATPSSP
ncbi:hypothetical protein Athai_60910 [Actinocatenispora thailandica]|uniref:Rho termination factor N-terminal domain-containing protein n=1 Tax=Actinocatenispora thailandica TaxID=227318 RepID=A0A7R7I105_9ACTN|nr:hypothetical protein Athai_60910 [Actinocatenispora thailandica]